MLKSTTLKRCYEKLGIRLKEANKVLTVRTMNGNNSSSSKYVEVRLSDDIKIKTFALAKDYVINQQKIDLFELWPTLDDTLAKEVKENFATGGVDMTIGLDHLYGKISNTRHILHPDKRLALVHTHSGYSIGGSIASRHETSNDHKAIQILTSTFEVKRRTNEAARCRTRNSKKRGKFI